ncbi:MAG: tetratricopeptide repeat protein, partial [Caulobacteraceae bacterium]
MTDARLIADPVAEAEAAVRANDLARAQDIAEAALARGVEHPMLLNLSAFRLESQGRLTQALQRLRRARELAPHDLPALNALGQCLARLERYPEAVEVFDDLLALNDKVAPAWFVRGSALDAMGDILAAEDSFARAVALKTDYAGPLAGLASLATRRGDHAEARRLGAAALAAEPGNSAALTAIAMAELGQNDFTGAEKRLRGLLADPRLALQQRVIAQGLLGDALHGQGRFAEAFAAYSASNEEERRLASPRFERSDADNPLQRARSVAAFVRAAPAEAWAVEAASGPAAGHAFVVGFPRSGTTLLETALAAHPRVVTLEERDTLEQGFEAYLRHPQNLARLADAPSGDLVRFRKAYWEKVEAEGADA